MKKYMTDYCKKEELTKQDFLEHLAFFQHERIVHLVITLTFAILEMLSLLLLCVEHSLFSFMLMILFLILLIPYIFHYYFLENIVQKMYKHYDSLTK